MLFLYDAGEANYSLLDALKRLASDKIHIILTTYKRVEDNRFKTYLTELPKLNSSDYQKIYQNLYPDSHPLAFPHNINRIAEMCGGNIYLYLALLQCHCQTDFQFLDDYSMKFRDGIPVYYNPDYIINISYRCTSKFVTMPEVYRFILNYNEYTENDFTILCRLALLNMSEMSWLFSQDSDDLFRSMDKNFFFTKKEKEYYPFPEFQRSCIYQAHGDALIETRCFMDKLFGNIQLDNIKPEKYSDIFVCLASLTTTWLTCLNYSPLP